MVLACIMVSGCIKEEQRNGEGFTSSVVRGNASLYTEDYNGLTVGEDGLIRCVVSHIKTPTEFDINFRNTRSVRLAGVSAPDVNSPQYAEARAYLYNYTGKGNPIFLRPLPGIDVKDERSVIVGFPLLVADRQPSPDQTLFVDLIQGMLSRGLLRITNYEEFDRPEVARAAHQAEEYARKNRVGIWGDPAVANASTVPAPAK